MNTVGVIPARWASTRLPGKSLIPICGKPLIQWVAERVAEARLLTSFVVATDDERIRDAVESFGYRAVMTSADHPTGTDRVAEAVRGENADVVINIQGDEPLIDPGLIDRLAETMASRQDLDMATAATPLRDPEQIASDSIVKVVRNGKGEALYFSRSVIPHVRDAADDGDGLYWRHVGIYAYRAEFLERLVMTPPCALEQAERLEQLRALHIGACMAVVETEEQGIGVDTPEDVEYVERLLKNRGNGTNGKNG